MGLFSGVILVASAQGIFLSLVLLKKKHKKQASNYILSIFIALISITLWGRLFYEIPEKSILQWKLLFIGDTIIYLFGPVFYFYIKRVFQQKIYSFNEAVPHFILAALFLISLLPLFLAEGFQMFSILSRYNIVYQATEFIAIFQLLIYLIYSNRIIVEVNMQKRLPVTARERVIFFKRMIVIMQVITLIWLVSATINSIRPPDFDLYLIYHLVWIGLAVIIYLIGYVSITQTTIFELPIISSPKATAQEVEVSQDLLLIRTVIEDTKAYLETDFSLLKLSELCNFTPHEVSKILNEHAGVNFSEFINQYRVNAFLENLTPENLEDFTILTLAFNAGFNSKTTFNKVFKKVTGLTPSQYISTEILR